MVADISEMIKFEEKTAAEVGSGQGVVIEDPQLSMKDECYY